MPRFWRSEPVSKFAMPALQMSLFERGFQAKCIFLGLFAGIE
ncbi:Hypothetical protein, conserved [Brucella melitensis ATCC 23457]|uniref:Uncharacterized protein n=1 Tax=Brucella melitensis biotype 2 (strain ATCC 23457) TaxID=546272 RepID=C0RFG0_BRUMB|nr:Hypothetical protein, conserved [Brucella melitensis ATCC 23457]